MLVAALAYLAVAVFTHGKLAALIEKDDPPHYEQSAVVAAALWPVFSIGLVVAWSFGRDCVSCGETKMVGFGYLVGEVADWAKGHATVLDCCGRETVNECGCWCGCSSEAEGEFCQKCKADHGRQEESWDEGEPW